MGCRHCGLPLRGEDAEGGYCCTGCAVAHHLSGRSDEGRADPLLARIVLSAFLSMGVMCFSQALYGEAFGGGSSDAEAARALEGLARLAALAFSTPVLLLLGLPLADAVWRTRRWLSADALVLAGALAAYGSSAWNTLFSAGAVHYETATVVLALFATGRWLDVRARERASRELVALIPECVRPVVRVGPRGEEEVDPASIARGDLVRLRPGDTVPVDGTVVEGRSFVDASALRGEEEPASVAAGERVLAGTSLVDGSLVVRAEAVGSERVRDAIERLLAGALASRPASIRVADRAAGALVPIVLALAAGTAAWRWDAVGPEQALLDALSVVLISCPCALGLATPLAFWTALGAAWKRGTLVRGGEALERLARVRRVFLDKTGTLTSGELELVAVETHGALDRGEALALAAALEQGSEHPIGRSLRRAARAAGLDAAPVDGFERLPGVGVRGLVAGEAWTLRRARAGDPGHSPAASETRVVLAREPRADAREGTSVATFALRAELRPGAVEAVAALARLAPRVLTGDGEGPARAIAAQLGVPVEHSLLPHEKLARVEAAGRAGTLFVGDGLNDVAALAAADVGVAVAGASPRSLEVADAHLLAPDLRALPELLVLARAATRTARANLAWAFAYNLVGLSLAVSGRLTPVFAASAMVVSSVAVLLNTARVGRGLRALPVRRAGGAAEPAFAPAGAAPSAA